MAGIYIHIPFCKQACHYCNFHFSTSMGMKSAMVDAIAKEAQLQKSYLETHIVETIYFGGGTPSILDTADIKQILDRIKGHFHLAEALEITLEANPDDLTLEKLVQLKSAGINRLSIGIQSFHEIDLKWMNRSHTAAQALRCIDAARAAGIADLSIDLIFGCSPTSIAMWQENLDIITQKDIPHISCYGLTVEPKTALAHQIKNQKITAPDEAKSAEQYKMTMAHLKALGYEHYEISNYAKKGQYSKHNTNYWRHVPYLGLGPAAHSYNGPTRQWNIANNKKYIDLITNDIVPHTMETLSNTDKLNEYLMTNLRTMWGCSLSLLKKQFPRLYNPLIKDLDTVKSDGDIIQVGDIIRLTPKGKMMADNVISQLFAEG